MRIYLIGIFLNADISYIISKEIIHKFKSINKYLRKYLDH